MVTTTRYEGAVDENTRTVYCSKMMVLDYESVIAAQAELNRVSAPFGGYNDGWGTFGNSEEQDH